MTKIYLFDEQGLFIAEQIALVDEFGKTILPENATFEVPLSPKDGFTVMYNGKRWIYKEDAKPEEILPYAHAKNYIEKRLNAYPDYGEQLDMIYWDRVNDTNKWEEKISEIKAKYPKVDLND